MKSTKEKIWIITLCLIFALWIYVDHRKTCKNYEKSLDESTTEEHTTVSMEFDYFQNDKGLWVYQGKTYKEKLDLIGKAENQEVEYIVLTNREDITFEKIYDAYGVVGPFDDERENLGLTRKYDKSDLVVVETQVK